MPRNKTVLVEMTIEEYYKAYKTPFTELATIRNALKLFWNTQKETWEVYTMLHGNGFKWIEISKENARMFRDRFHAPIVFSKEI